MIHLKLEGVRIDRIVGLNLQGWHEAYGVVVKPEVEGGAIGVRVPNLDST